MSVCGSVALLSVQEHACMTSGTALLVEAEWHWRLPYGLPQGHLRPDPGRAWRAGEFSQCANSQDNRHNSLVVTGSEKKAVLKR